MSFFILPLSFRAESRADKNTPKFSSADISAQNIKLNFEILQLNQLRDEAGIK